MKKVLSYIVVAILSWSISSLLINTYQKKNLQLAALSKLGINMNVDIAQVYADNGIRVGVDCLNSGAGLEKGYWRCSLFL